MISHCSTCTCADSLTDDELDAFSKQERTGTEPGHEHCPDCGCNPNDHMEHAEGCRRIGQSTELQCGPPWKPWSDTNPALTA